MVSHGEGAMEGQGWLATAGRSQFTVQHRCTTPPVATGLGGFILRLGRFLKFKLLNTFLTIMISTNLFPWVCRALNTVTVAGLAT